MSIWLIGAGPHAREYAKVLIALGQSFVAIGRGEQSAKAFEDATGHTALSGGMDRALKDMPAPDLAIVSVSFEALAATAIALIEAGTRRILLEKPGGLTVAELERVAAAAAKHQTQVWIAYNRRFYASTQAARRMIADDGGALSCNFEFTEWSHTIEPTPLPAEVKATWLIANSSHVIDLAFHLCGLPVDWKGWHAGGLEWHSESSRFCGAGVTDQGVLFSYHADWEAPGRWAVEVLTRKRRFIFKPMEQLQVTQLASVTIESILIDDALDKTFKPGLYEQTKAFLAEDPHFFCSIDDQVKHGILYSQIAGYA